MKICGYTTPWCAQAGEVIDLHISVTKHVGRIQLVRLDDIERKIVDLPVVQLPDAPVHRMIDQGSYLRIDKLERVKTGRLKSLSFELYLTQNDGIRTVFEADGFTALHVNNSIIIMQNAVELMRLDQVPSQTWLKLQLTIEAGIVSFEISSYDILAPFNCKQQARLLSDISDLTALLIGSDTNLTMRCLNARYSSLCLEAEYGKFFWDFPALFTSEPLLSKGSDTAIALETFGLPSFCMTSARWDGTSFDPRIAPAHYDAIHCHDDDMDGLEWPASYRVTLPQDCPSGIYAFCVECENDIEDIVFFVAPQKPAAKLVFVVPTATYLAYADEFLPPHLYTWQCDDRGHRLAQENQFKSLYDYHTDLSGVSICSYRKVKATLRPDYCYPLGDCPHNLPVDLEFLKFCRRNTIAVDVITDHDLHHRGLQVLQPYDAVLTGSHPEYLSAEMEHAYRQFAAGGGSIVYLGGNGFATTVAFKDDLMELRRSPLEAGRTWDGAIGEQAFALTNEPGGYLRSRGRGEFSLTGVAMSLMGFETGRPFNKTSEGCDPKHSWLFAGVSSDCFGETGRILGAAAGYEVDATDKRMGTSADTYVVARADGFPDSFYHDPSRWYEGGEAQMQTRRCAEMTVRYLKSGGLIFSASSVAWLGALPEGDAMNDVGRITLNVLKHVQNIKDLPEDKRKSCSKN